MHDAKVQPVPCVLHVFMREERSSKMVSPGIIIFNNRVSYKHKLRKAMLLTDSSLKHTIEEDINSIRWLGKVATFDKHISETFSWRVLQHNNVPISNQEEKTKNTAKWSIYRCFEWAGVNDLKSNKHLSPNTACKKIALFVLFKKLCCQSWVNPLYEVKMLVLFKKKCICTTFISHSQKRMHIHILRSNRHSFWWWIFEQLSIEHLGAHTNTHFLE